MAKNKTKPELQAELQQAQKRVKELELSIEDGNGGDRFASVFRASPFQMAFTELNTGKYVDVNAAFLSSLGFSREEVIGRTASELNLFADATQRGELLKRMAEQGFLRNEHVRVRRRSGEVLHGIFTAEYVDVQGQKLLLTIMNDVTEKIRAEERWQFALDGAAEGVWDWNVQTNKVFYSHRWKSMLGYEDSDIGDSLDEWSSRVHPDDLFSVMEDVNQHLNGETPIYITEHRVRCKDGSYKWILDSGKVMEWTEDKRPVRVIGTHRDITDRKIAEEAVRENEERFSRMFHSNPSVQIIVAVQDGKILDVNESFCQQTGFARHELIGRSTGELNLWQDPARQKWIIEELRSKGQVRNIELEFRAKTGEARTLLTSFEIIEIKGVVCSLSSGVDITARKAAEKALLESQAELSQVLTKARMGTWTYHLPTNQFKWSKEAAQLFGVDTLQEDFAALMGHFHPDDRQKALEAFQKVMSSGRFSNLEYRMIGCKGDIIWVTNYGHVEYDENGKPVLISGLLQDITERREMAENLLNSEERYRIISDTVTDYAFSTRVEEGGEYVMDWVSGAFETITGYTFDEFIASGGWRARLHPDDRLADDEARRALLANQKAISEVRIFHKDGREVFLRVFARPLWDEKENRLKAIYGAVQDITERRRLERELEAEAVRRRILFEEAPDGVLVIDPETASFLEFNTAAHTQLGYTREEFANLHIYEVEAQETAEETQSHIRAVVREGRSDFETLQRTKQGELRNVHVTAMLVDVLGKPVYYCIWRDVTERKQAEIARHESDELYHLLFREMTQGVVIQNNKGAMVHANPAAQKIMGLTLEQMQGKTSVSANYPMYREDGSVLPAQEHPAAIVLKTRKPVYNMVLAVFNPNFNSNIWLNINAMPRFINGGPEPYQIFTIFEDITERKQAELKLRESEKRLRSMLEISRAMSASLEMEAVLQKIVENAAGLFELESGAIYTVEGNDLYLEATTPPLPDGFPDALRLARVADHPHIQSAISNGATVVLEDATLAELSSAEKLAAESRGLRSILYIPLMVLERPVGVLIVASVGRTRTFSEEEIALYSGFSGQAAQTIENIRLYETEQKYTARLEAEISERKQAEEKLSESEARFQQIANNVGEVFWMFDNREHKLVYLNAAYEKIWGRSIEETYQSTQHYVDAIHPEDRGVMFAALERQGRGERTEMEYRVVQPDGSMHWISDRSFPIYGEDGTLLRTTGIATDITGRRQAEDDLRESEARYRLIAENSADVIWVLDPVAGKFTYVSPSVEKLRGYTPEEVMAQPVSEALTPESQKMISASLEVNLPPFLAKGSGTMSFTNQVDQPCKDGSIVNTEVTTTYLFNEQGNVEIVGVSRNITERRRAEQRYRALIEYAPDGIVLIDINGKFKYASPSVERIFGYAQEDLPNCNSVEMTHPEDLPVVLGELTKLLEQPSHIPTLQYRFRHKNGEWRWIESTFSNLLAAPSLEAIIINFRDIHERKSAEEKLRVSQAHFATLFHSNPNPIALVALSDNKLQDVNQSWEKLTGWTKDEAIGKTPLELNLWVDPSARERLVGLMKGQGAVSGFELETRTKSGVILNQLMSAEFITLAGEPCMLSITQDITDRKRAEEELRLAERRYRAMIENAPDGIALVDAGGKFKYLSPAGERLTGYTLPEIQQLDPAEITHPDEVIMVIEELEKVIRDPSYNPTVQYRFRHNSGEWRWVESTFSNLLALPGLEAIILNFRDITERRQAEEALQKSQTLLQEAQRIARVGHIEWNGGDLNLICSDEIYDIFELPHGTPLSQDVIAGTMTPDERDRLNRLDQVAIQQRADMEYEYSIRTRAGGVRWLHQMGRMTYGDDGAPTRMLAIIQDVTERKKAEHILSESRTRLEMALIGAKAGMWDWNVQSGQTVFNERWAEIVGYSLAELEPVNINTWVDLCHPDDLERSDELLKRHFSGETEFYSCEARMKHKNGSWVWVLDQGKVMEWDGDGKPVRMFGTHLDITKQKREELYTQAVLRLTNLSYESSQMDDLMRAMLDEAEVLTDSQIGFFHFVDEDQNAINLQAWSTNTVTNMCTAEGKGQHYPVAQAGVWADAIRKGEACIYNDYGSAPDRKGLPAGHAPVQRLISLPVKRNNLVVAALGVGNKPQAYTDQDLDILSRLSDAVFDIILRKRAEEALRKNEYRFRTVADFTYDMEFWLDEEQNLLYVSPSCKRITGYEREQFLKEPALLSEIIHPEDRFVFDKHIKEEFTLAGSCTLDFRIIDAGGAVRWINHTCQAVTGDDGSFRGRRVSHRDVTDQKQVLKELRTSEEKYRVLLESLDSVVANIDLNGRFLYMNDTAAAMLGGGREQPIGRMINELFPTQAAEIQMRDIQIVAKADQGMTFENMIHVSGQPRWYRTSILPLHDETGRVASVLVNSTDIHELKTMQQELQELNRTLEEKVKERTAEVQDLYDNAPTGYHSIDADGKFVRVNQTGLNWLGYSREEMIGTSADDFMTEKSRAVFQETLPLFLKRGWINDLELEFVRRDGSILPVSLNATAIEDENGNFVMSRSTIFDITERKKAEETMRRANSELARALRTKDEFLANISHELRTPLNGILGFTEMLLSGEFGTLDDRQMKYLGSIDSSGRHLLGLINDLLDLAKIEAGKLEITPEKVVLTDLCQASLIFVKQAALKKSIHVEFENGVVDSVIIADQRRLKQILVNLLSNAVKFTPENGRVNLKTSFDPDQQCILFSVRDTGIGISPEDIQRLFKPFTQVDSSLTRSHEGTGLGLALVRELVEMHGGSIHVESEVGVGSTFTVSIPQTRPVRADPEMPGEAMPVKSVVEDNIQPIAGRILLAEDMESNIMIVRDYLEMQGFEVIIARNGLEAVSMCKQAAPDLILMDIQMPEMDGLEATRRIRADSRFATLPIIALTALAMTGDRERCFEAGATEYLSKPMNLKKLNEMIRSLLDGKRR